MEIKPTKIPDCFEIYPRILKDERGSFVKTFHQEIFFQNRLEINFAEEYYSISKEGVLRGLHFQLPPKDHTKIVYCVFGRVIDAVLDLRVGSPTYGIYELFELNDEKTNVIYIPKGVAHGFYVTSKHAIMMYKVTTVYSPEHDSGILWNSAGIPWPSVNPTTSKRDSEFIKFKDFKSPFYYDNSRTSQ